MAPLAQFQEILGIRFYVGDLPGLIDLTIKGGLIVVPSAPVLAEIESDTVLRAALRDSDVALTDSGFMVLLWKFFHGQSLPRISGLKYLRALIQVPRFREPKATFWVMPSNSESTINRAWLKEHGIIVEMADCYTAPYYPSRGMIQDPLLLALVEERKPKFVIICLGGGVQERLGLFLRNHLLAFKTGTPGGFRPESTGIHTQSPARVSAGLASESQLPIDQPALVCTGAAIAFISGLQANIPPWADRLMLGWLFRILQNPLRFLPRYWKARKFLPLLWRYSSNSAGGN